MFSNFILAKVCLYEANVLNIIICRLHQTNICLTGVFALGELLSTKRIDCPQSTPEHLPKYLKTC